MRFERFEEVPAERDKRSSLVPVLVVVGVLMMGLCCLVILVGLLISARATPAAPSTRAPVVVERAPTQAAPVPSATRTPVPQPTQPGEACAPHEGIACVRYALESGNAAYLAPFITRSGVIVAPSGIGLHGDTVADFTHSSESIIAWLSDGLARSRPSCYGYKLHQGGQRVVVMTGLNLDWRPMLGDYPTDFEGVSFVLEPRSNLPQGYALTMIIGEWTGMLETLEVSACTW